MLVLDLWANLDFTSYMQSRRGVAGRVSGAWEGGEG